MDGCPPDVALRALLDALKRRDYRFVTPLNSTIRVVRERDAKPLATSLRDVFGWSLPFRPGSIDPEVEGLLEAAGCLTACNEGLKATVRVSRLLEGLFAHSAFPAREKDAVFLGPDSYRFAEYLRREVVESPSAQILDVGAGAGVGGVVAARAAGAATVVLSDINPRALRFAVANAAHAGVAATPVLASGLDGALGEFDIIVANPPFIAEGGKIYSEGGGLHGLQLSLDWATAAIPRLHPGGRLLMYTGAAIVGGEDAFADAMQALAEQHGCRLNYRELDPDIFGGQLGRAPYRDVERIAAVGLALTRA